MPCATNEPILVILSPVSQTNQEGSMLKPLTKSSVFAAFFFLVGAVMTGQVCSEWLWSNPMPQGNRLNGAALGNGGFVAVRGSGTALTRRDRRAGSTQRLPG